MNDEPAQANSGILDLTRPGIIEASAGTGKTYSIAEIYLALLCGRERYAPRPPANFEPGYNANPPSVKEILVVTFTEAATNELSERLQKRIREAIKQELPPDADEQAKVVRQRLRLADAEFDEAAISTIHGFCMRILRDFSFECGLPPNLLPAESTSEEMKRFAARFRTREILAGNKQIESLTNEGIRKILEALAKNPDIAVRPDNGNEDDPRFYVATRGLQAWTEERKKNEQLSFDEVLLRLRDALRQSPQLADKIAARYRVALVDEFQDTDPVQWEIFKLIFIKKRRPLFCVGDPKQAIYAFRGGDIRTYNQARNEILRISGNNCLSLTTNWRSTPEMIEAFNELFRADDKIGDFDGSHVGKNLRYQDAVPAPTHAEPADGAAIFLRTGFEGNKDNCLEAVTQKAVEDIRTLVTEHGIPPEAVAVLVQRNEEAARFLDELTKAGIPAAMCATGSVLETDEARNLQSLLEAVIEPRRTATVARAALCEYFGTSFFGAIARTDADAEEKLNALREKLVEAQKIWEYQGLPAAFSFLDRSYGIRTRLAELSQASKRLVNTAHLLELLQNEAHTRHLSPQALLKRFSEMINSPREDADAEALRINTDRPAVTIMTIHKSKGLQFEIVFLPHLWSQSLAIDPKNAVAVRKESEDGKFETLLRTSENDSAFSREAVEEDAKTKAGLAYVAFTRAKKACVVYHADKAAVGSSKKPLVSYLSKILAAAGIFGGDSATPPLRRWKVLAPDEAFPPIKFEPNEAPSTRNSPQFLPGPGLSKDNWGIFSFSRIIGNHTDPLPANLENETASSEKDIAEETPLYEIFQAPEYCDLPAGRQFGTLVHAVFEEVDFRTHRNLDALIERYRERFPRWLDDETARQKFRKMFEDTLELPIDGKNAKLAQIDSARDTLRELEFLFAAKKSDNLYAALNDVFSAWGGIYKRTAEFHWANGDAGTLPIDGLMHGYIDLVARSGGRYYIADWKTSRIVSPGTTQISRQNLEDEIVESGYALQWAIYAVALRKYLRSVMGDAYSSEKHFGGIAYFFVRWNTAFYDTAWTDTRLDALENVLTGGTIR